MFCTNLRRRPSFAPAIPHLSSAESLKLREARLETHDIAVPLFPGLQGSARHLRLLLLSPSTVSGSKLPDTISRIQHFAALTGGQDLAIIFLLNPPATSKFISAKDLSSDTASSTADTTGIYALATLQSTLFTRPEIPHIPILPIASLSALPQVVKKHVAALSRPKLRLPLQPTPVEILQLCSTAEMGMHSYTAQTAAQVFGNLRDVASTCAGASEAVGSSSPLTRASVALTEYGTGGERLRQMKSYFSGEEWKGMVEFWEGEYAVDY